MQPCRERDKGFEIEDANLLILKWGMKTGFYFHKDYEESIGFIFDENATCSSHVSNICRAAFHSLYRIGKIRHLLNRASTERLIHAFITSRLDFCNSLLHHLPQNLTHKLHRIQNAAARLITRSKKHDHITPILIELHWLPVSKRTDFKILILTYEILHDLAPAYLSELLAARDAKRVTRSATTETRLVEPHYSQKSYGARAFSVCATRLWNRHP